MLICLHPAPLYPVLLTRFRMRLRAPPRKLWVLSNYILSVDSSHVALSLLPGLFSSSLLWNLFLVCLGEDQYFVFIIKRWWFSSKVKLCGYFSS